jgi:hypothetical protein
VDDGGTLDIVSREPAGHLVALETMLATLRLGCKARLARSTIGAIESTAEVAFFCSLEFAGRPFEDRKVVIGDSVCWVVSLSVSIFA